MSFFYKQAECRKNHNTIREIHSQGQTFNKFDEIKQEAHSFYRNLYTEEMEVPPRLDHYPLSAVPMLVNEEDNRMMTTPITSEEISNALHGMNPNKAPGPDGFSAKFFIAY